MPILQLVRATAAPTHLDYVDWMRTATGTNPVIADFIEAQGGYLGGTPSGWTRYGAVLQSNWHRAANDDQRDTLAVALVGEAGHRAFKAWEQAQAA